MYKSKKKKRDKIKKKLTKDDIGPPSDFRLKFDYIMIDYIVLVCNFNYIISLIIFIFFIFILIFLDMLRILHGMLIVKNWN